MRTPLTLALLFLSTWCFPQTVTITGTVSKNSCAYANGSGRAVLVPQNQSFFVNGTNPVNSPVVISGLDSFGAFSVSLTNTALISPASASPQWQLSFCSQAVNGQQPACFTMTPMALTTSQDISTQIQAQAAPIQNCSVGTPITLKTNNVLNGSQTLLNLQQGSHIALTDNGLGQVTVADTLTPLTLQTNGITNGSQTLLNLAQGSGITLTDNGSGQVTVAATGSGGTVTGTGTTNTLPLWTNGPSGVLGNSNFSQSGTAMNLSSQSIIFTGTIGRILCAACNSSPDMFWSTGSATSPSNTDTHIRMEKDIGSGGQIIFVAGTAASLAQAVLNSDGTAGWWQYPQTTFANLPSAPNGSRLYCTNCKEVTDPCSTGGGTGAGDFADRINGRWKCN